MRSQTTRHEINSETWEEALARVLRNPDRMAEAEKTLQAAADKEPLIADLFITPQSPPHHAEGPFVDFHVRRILAVLSAVCSGDLNFKHVEEFRRLKGFEHELEELQEILCERQALFETFALCHDAAKFAAATCVASVGSWGADLGFDLTPKSAWEDEGVAERALLRRRYVELYRTFGAEHVKKNPAEIEAAFFAKYSIGVHYPGHDRMIHSPVYRGLLERVGEARRLTVDDINLLEDVIGHHLQPLADFDAVHPERIGRYAAVAQKRGWDEDEFLNVLQAGVFLDAVAGSRHLEDGKSSSALAPFINFLQSEHNYAPWKRVANQAAREEKHKRERQTHFREVGLDGISLLTLLGMEPGPKFGIALKALYAAVEGQATMPTFPPAIAKEVAHRVEKYYEIEFPKA